MENYHGILVETRILWRGDVHCRPRMSGQRRRAAAATGQPHASTANGRSRPTTRISRGERNRPIGPRSSTTPPHRPRARPLRRRRRVDEPYNTRATTSIVQMCSQSHPTCLRAGTRERGGEGGGRQQRVDGVQGTHTNQARGWRRAKPTNETSHCARSSARGWRRDSSRGNRARG